MKNSVLILTSLFLITLNINAQWLQVNNGMGNRTVRSFAYSGNVLFAGTSSAGVFLSTNDGANWSQTSLNNRDILSLAFNGNTIFAGTGVQGVTFYGIYLSTDNGTSWSQTSLNNRHVNSIAVNANTIFAGTANYGVYFSTNNGVSWTQTNLDGKSVVSLALIGNNVFAGTLQNGVYVSSNNGTNWTQTSLNNINVRSLAVNGNSIYAGTESSPSFGVYLSTNNGANWTQTGLNNVNVYSLAASGNNVFAGSYTYGFYMSTNNGVNWIQKNEGLGNQVVAALCLFDNFIFAGVWNGLSVFRRQLSDLTFIQSVSNEIPNQYSLSQNYPNPFNPSTKIQFTIPASSSVAQTFLSVYDILGREITTLVNQQLSPGTYSVEWNASNYPSGIYFFRLSSGNFTETRKMILVK